MSTRAMDALRRAVHTICLGSALPHATPICRASQKLVWVLGPDYLAKLDTERIERRAVQRLQQLSYELVLTPKQEVASLF